MKFELVGKFQPYTRRTRQGRYSERAQAYHASQNGLYRQFANQMALAGWDMLPRSTPLVVSARIVMASCLHVPDLDNQGKALLDAAQKLVFWDDCWVDELHLVRELGEDYLTQFEVDIR